MTGSVRVLNSKIFLISRIVIAKSSTSGVLKSAAKSAAPIRQIETSFLDTIGARDVVITRAMVIGFF